MATSALGQNINTAAGLAQLATALFGGGDTTVKKSGGTTTSSSTKQTNISQSGLTALIQAMMEDPSTGLAKVASGAKAPGMYNSTTQQLMVNDLISRASNAAALASAPTTTTATQTETPTTTTQKSSGMLGSGGSNMLLPLLGAGMLMKKDASGKSMFDTLSSSLGGFFGGDSEASGDFVLGGASALSGSITGMASDILSPVNESAFQLGDLDGLISSTIGEGIDYGSIGSGIDDVASGVGSFIEETYDDVVEWIGGWF